MDEGAGPGRSPRAGAGYLNKTDEHEPAPPTTLLGPKQMAEPPATRLIPFVLLVATLRVSAITLPAPLACTAKFWLESTTVSIREPTLAVPLMLTPPLSGFELRVPFWKMNESFTISFD